ncbi:tRNA (adenosine(37)-N6)-dimethylallyltransferase MiaA [Candidatus Azambacteria bacterium RIFCSPHIGHO2_01_FULL_44_55]|uniref:tRNA dimethylallyltransferase n=1 Tax=Candidatus Azambacteria bacterium RIFCSPLOWO2_02_FULL_44_14 TaxID=1797306 RepID=A0A1F5CCZ6_9BACT|nr:MAG: tRNA (adenosine(37)-N6)-dimethylallyltransferase MiaA [Candidatus Azambacteria bacterium RIFCSPHIGHO2_02_FULL_45_18]OGD40730.1 MAG: tRNA (adenosine(37)-N6)-dimethylallyltransferase MiaA [Candidatus Azambacteria bacterium RIFCSPLOWO2_02_FULL_44_14]OGD40830.1 MAG: tRNA (adenosine(37)-N6)-dimethylallyltransferase MiaA [Candidatus Azambacteria bacterium RIFCSPHIGHO2_01_FULL_44_55]OGD51543.1 MAG: tRNA (adenosine(37)-N6)-dimethylallyltransferase MiaA [Candidatus Azambacteria bacterium RIFOXYD1
MKLKKPKIIVVVGPTASGKTGLAIKIAKKFGGEIVSADSRQIYRGMDIGTAKPTKKEMAAIPHYLIDINNPDENYTVAEYKRDAVKAIKSILKKGKLPILVGGTGLYVKSVIDNLEIPNVPPDPKLRQKLELRIKNYGLKSLYNELIKLDPEAAYIVDPHNPRRIIRALEIALKTKKPFSAQRKAGRMIFDFIEFGIYRPKEELEKRIDKRIDLMMKDGFLKEVKELVEKYGQNNQNFDTIGYREIIDYLNRKITLPEAVELIKKNTRNYAKRQMTWFRKDKRIRWIKDEKEALSLGASFLS